jgi:hypothetical protein
MRSHDLIDASWTERDTIRHQLVIARCDPPTAGDLVEEPFDQIAGLIQI